MFYYSKIDSTKINEDNVYTGEVPAKMVAHEWCLLCKEINLPEAGMYCDVMGDRKTTDIEFFEDPIIVVSFENEYSSIENFKRFTNICDNGFDFGKYHYVYLVTSGSALKHREIWFYRSDIKNPRNWWGIDHEYFVKKKTEMKAMLYEGLWLTSCIEWEDFPHDRVCCLPDLKINIKTNGMYVSPKGNVQYKENVDATNNVNDGMGWIRKSAVPELVQLSEGGAFQIRGPWCKGLLRIVDDSFFEGARLDNWKNMIDLSNYDIIFSDSVFKGACGYESMEAFMEQKPVFGYVVPCTKKRTLNYQILNPLNLSTEEKFALSYNNREEYADLLYGENEQFGFNVDLIVRGLKALALQGMRPEHLTTKTLSKAYSNMLDGKKRRLLGGRWDVNHGEVKAVNAYLNCDPYYYFYGVSMLQPHEVCDKRFKDGELVAIARNPQISVHEWVLARNRITADAAYGVIDLPAESALAQTLSGADYDGDQVLVTNNPIIINALKRQSAELRELYNIEGLEGDEADMWISMPILFDEPKKNHVSFWRACWGEFNNNEFTVNSNHGTRAYLKFRNDLPKKHYYGCIFSAMVQVGVDSGKYQYKMPEVWLKIKRTFQKMKLPLSPESFFWKRDYDNMSSYTGIIDKKFGTFYTIRPEDTPIDTVKRDKKGRPVGAKRYTPKGCNEKVMTEHWQIIVNTYQKMLTELDTIKQEEESEAADFDMEMFA